MSTPFPWIQSGADTMSAACVVRPSPSAPTATRRASLLRRSLISAMPGRPTSSAASSPGLRPGYQWCRATTEHDQVIAWGSRARSQGAISGGIVDDQREGPERSRRERERDRLERPRRGLTADPSDSHGGRHRPSMWAMYDVATAAVEAALNAGARYAGARVMEMRTEAMAARNGAVESLDREERAGVGVRALIGSSWGFFAVPDAGSAAARRAGEQAAAVARASTLVPGVDLGLAEEPATQGSWQSDYRVDPWSVSLAEKGDLLESVTRTMGEHGADVSEASHRIWDTRKWLVSSEGHRIDQHIVE